mmetsp:Transcript_6544/g.22548  ORF Transcript_6544/g.22548 Transcript_6544/m.22548 type:complete len:231 (-) Transcript_6544:249-941(-)
MARGRPPFAPLGSWPWASRFWTCCAAPAGCWACRGLDAFVASPKNEVSSRRSASSLSYSCQVGPPTAPPERNPRFGLLPPDPAPLEFFPGFWPTAAPAWGCCAPAEPFPAPASRWWWCPFFATSAAVTAAACSLTASLALVPSPFEPWSPWSPSRCLLFSILTVGTLFLTLFFLQWYALALGLKLVLHTSCTHNTRAKRAYSDIGYTPSFAPRGDLLSGRLAAKRAGSRA